MSRTTVILLMILLLVIGVYIAVTRGKPQQKLLANNVQQTPTKGQNEAILSLQTDKKQNVGVIQVNIVMNSYSINPAITQLEIGYDPLTLQAAEITPGNLFTHPKVLLYNINNRSGRISYAIRCNTTKADECINDTKKNIASITFLLQNTNQKRTTQVQILPKSIIRDFEDKVIDVKMEDGNIVLPMNRETTASPSALLQ